MTKVRVLEINGKNIDVTKRTLKEDRVSIGKEELPFKSEQIFNMAVKVGNKVSIRRKPTLIHVAGKSTFTEYKELDENLEGITNKDRKNFVLRMLARAITNVKPISTSMFLVLLGVGIVNIIIMILGFSGRIG